MAEIDARGENCPLPVIRAKNALKEIQDGETLIVLVDNEIAVQNLGKMAKELSFEIEIESADSENYAVSIFKGEKSAGEFNTVTRTLPDVSSIKTGDFIVVISSDRMGEGDGQLGRALLKAFIFSLGEQEVLPAKIIFYNSGAFITTDSVDSADSINDLKKLEAMGVEIMTCGACLNYYKLTDKLAVGSVTNMYSILGSMAAANKIIRP